jgi:hypothetical protein
MAPQGDRLLRRFTASGPPFFLSPEQRQALAEALCGGDAPDKVIDEVEEAIQHAHSDTRLRMDSPRAVSEEGQKELLLIEDLLRQSADALRNKSGEVQHFLDFEVPDGATEDVGILAGQVARSRRLHECELAKRRSPIDGAPGKGVALQLALQLAPIWAEWSGRGWSHHGAWGRFVGLAFDIAGVEASGEAQARKAAGRFRGGETPL